MTGEMHMDSDLVRDLGRRMDRLSGEIIDARDEILRKAEAMDWDGPRRDGFTNKLKGWGILVSFRAMRCRNLGIGATREAEEWEEAAAHFGWGVEGYTPFLVGENENTGPDEYDIDQDRIGDCYLLSSLGSIAQHHPEVIEDMIEVLEDGKCRVRFYDKVCQTIFGPCEYVAHYIIVDMDFPEGHAWSTDKSIGSQEVWTLVIEKAYLQWQKENDPNNPFIDWPLPAVAMSAITGKNSVTYPSMMMSFDTLNESFQRGDAITSGAYLQSITEGENGPIKLPPDSVYPKPYQNKTISTDHVYFITNVDPVTQEVTLQNPASPDWPPIIMPFSEYQTLFPLTMTNPVV